MFPSNFKEEVSEDLHALPEVLITQGIKTFVRDPESLKDDRLLNSLFALGKCSRWVSQPQPAQALGSEIKSVWEKLWLRELERTTNFTATMRKSALKSDSNARLRNSPAIWRRRIFRIPRLPSWSLLTKKPNYAHLSTFRPWLTISQSIGMTSMCGWNWPIFMRKNKSELISFERAIYCYEEILLIDPQRFHLYNKLAELHFSVGKVANLNIAKKYFCFLLSINSMALRPLLGLLKTCELLNVLEKNPINAKIVEIVQAKLKTIYNRPQTCSSAKGIY